MYAPPSDLASRQRFILRAGGAGVLGKWALAAALQLGVVRPLPGPLDAPARLLLAARCVGVAVMTFPLVAVGAVLPLAG